MSTLHAALVTLVATRLAALGDAAETELMPSSDPVAFPARHIFDEGHALGDSDAGSTRFDLGITVEGYVEQAGGTAAYLALHDLYAATVRALITEPPLDGLAETIDEGDLRIFVAPRASRDRLSFSLDLSITFSACRDDPAQPA